MGDFESNGRFGGLAGDTFKTTNQQEVFDMTDRQEYGPDWTAIGLTHPETGASRGEPVAWVRPAHPAHVRAILAATPGDGDGRSGWRWVRLPRGDLALAVFPHGETYKAAKSMIAGDTASRVRAADLEPGDCVDLAGDPFADAALGGPGAADYNPRRLSSDYEPREVFAVESAGAAAVRVYFGSFSVIFPAGHLLPLDYQGDSGQDRESYSDDQDRESYT